MFKASAILIALLMYGRPAQAQDAFSSIQCGTSLPGMLIGKVMPQGAAKAIETRYPKLGLKNQGASDISDSLNLESWTICGGEYALLVDRRDVIRDALLLPEHSRRRPGFLGSCEVEGRKSPGVILAVLDNPSPLAGEKHYASSDSTLLTAVSAWRIDEKLVRLVKIPTTNVRCVRSGISTIDGGP